MWAPIFASPKRHAAQAAGEKEVWALIFEKAWAKLHRCYEATAGGRTADTASYLSAGTLRTVDLGRADGDEDEWERLHSVANPPDGVSYVFLSCAVRGGEAAQEAASVGLVTGHAYSILKMHQAASGSKFVRVRNPWGQHEWCGRFSDKSADWTPALRAELGFVDEEDGTFFMLWEDFIKYFGAVELCDPTALASLSAEGALSPDSVCKVVSFVSHWVSGHTAGGGPRCATFRFNPTVLLTATQDGPCELTLFQPDVRPNFDPLQEAPARSPYGPCVLSLVEGEGDADECTFL